MAGGQDQGIDVRQLVGVGGIVMAAMAAQLNDQVLSIALPDIAGGIGISEDPASWLRTIFVVGEVLGMCTAPSLGLALSFRRFALLAIALSCLSSVMMMATNGTASVLMLRFVQGLAAGFTIPLLMTLALRVLGPSIRLYGLSIYALTATFTPNLAISFAALWTDEVRDWRFVCLQPIPFCAIAAAMVWWGVKQEPPNEERLRFFDWPGALLALTGFGSLSIALEQGDRLDWFNSELISGLLLLSLIAIPLFVWRERRARVPLMKLELLKRRNLLYAVITLVIYLVVGQGASQVPLTYLEQVHGYRPLEAQGLTLFVALSQLVLLPLTAWILDHRAVDARWINAVGYLCVLVACIGGASMDSSWVRDQFWAWQVLWAIGSAFIIMPLLMLATNVIKPEEGPFGSALFNTPRAVAEAIGAWVLGLIARWRGGLHRDRIVDIIGQNRFALPQAGGMPDRLGPDPGGVLDRLDAAIRAQVTTLVTIDTYLILGGLVILLAVALALIPQRSLPPRLQLAKQ